METIYIETYYEGEIVIPREDIEKLPKSIVLATTIQFVKQLDLVKKQLEDAGIGVELFRSPYCDVDGQILGCDVFEYQTKAEAFLYLGDGRFHPKALLYANNLPVYVYNPFASKFETLDLKDRDILEKKKKVAISKFVIGRKIGVLISTKPGQCKLNSALELKEKFSDKDFYFFISDMVDLDERENFNFIDCWINTACPRLFEDVNVGVLNLVDLRKLNF